MRRLIIFGIILLNTLVISAQKPNFKIQGVVLSSVDSLEPLPFTRLALFKDSILLFNAQSDAYGQFQFERLLPGMYELKCSSIGFQNQRVNQITVGVNPITALRVVMTPSAIEMKEFVVVQYKNRLIDKGNTSVKRTISSEDYSNMATRTTSGTARNTAGVYRSDDGSGSLNIRGARSDANYYYIDGMKVMGSSSIGNLHRTSYNYQNPTKITEAPVSDEEYASFTDHAFKKVRAEPLSTFSVDVDKASYTNVRRFITQGYLPPADAVRIEEMVNYFSYDYPQPEENQPFSISTEYTACPWNTQHKLVHIGIQGREIDLNEAAANNLVFLIDVSGSMGSQDKLGLVKIGLNLLVDQLREEDQVAIVVYAGAAGLVLPSTSGDQKQVIKSALNRLQSGGSTAGGQGIQLAYAVAKSNFIQEGNNRIIMASDGDFNVGISRHSELIRLIESKRDDDIFLTTLGFGQGNLKDSNMEQLANKGNGHYNYIDNALEARKVFVSELGSNLITIAKDVKVQVEFNPSIVKGYKLIGYVNRKLENKDFNDDTKDAGEIGSGHSVTMMYEIIPAESEESVDDIDVLKYQRDPLPAAIPVFEEEVLTVKFRYKAPKGKTSQLITHVLKAKEIPFHQTSTNCQFSSSVASFGMLLRGKEMKTGYSYDRVMELAKSARGTDEDGSRGEFINLVQLASSY